VEKVTFSICVADRCGNPLPDGDDPREPQWKKYKISKPKWNLFFPGERGEQDELWTVTWLTVAMGKLWTVASPPPTICPQPPWTTLRVAHTAHSSDYVRRNIKIFYRGLEGGEIEIIGIKWHH
jgi:hypothetical protein